MKKFLIFIVVIVAFSLILGTFLQKLPAMPILADGFFQSIKVGQPEQGYELFSNEYQQAVSLEQYKTWLQVTRLDQYQNVRWAGKGIMKNDQGKLAGVLYTKSGDSFPVVFYYVLDENKRWRISNVEIKPISTQ